LVKYGQFSEHNFAKIPLKNMQEGGFLDLYSHDEAKNKPRGSNDVYRILEEEQTPLSTFCAESKANQPWFFHANFKNAVKVNGFGLRYGSNGLVPEETPAEIKVEMVSHGGELVYRYKHVSPFPVDTHWLQNYLFPEEHMITSIRITVEKTVGTIWYSNEKLSREMTLACVVTKTIYENLATKERREYTEDTASYPSTFDDTVPYNWYAVFNSEDKSHYSSNYHTSGIHRKLGQKNFFHHYRNGQLIGKWGFEQGLNPDHKEGYNLKFDGLHRHQ
jgi:hypothetical protein